MRRGGFLKFSTALPGVLTGPAAAIASVVSFVALLGPGADAGPATDTTFTSGGPPSSGRAGSGSASGTSSTVAARLVRCSTPWTRHQMARFDGGWTETDR